MNDFTASNGLILRQEGSKLRILEAETGDNMLDGLPWLGSMERDALREFFDAHPVSKPWHSAQPGEVWALTTKNVGDEVAARAATVNDTLVFEYVASINTKIDVTDPRFVTGRRIWPEGS